MKKLFFILVSSLAFASCYFASAQSFVVETQSLGTNRHKTCLEGYVPVCTPPPLYKVYKTEDVIFSWSQQWYVYSKDTNGNTFLSAKDEVSASGVAAHEACLSVTNASGSITYTQTDYANTNNNFSYSATMTNSGEWVDTSTPPAGKWWQTTELYLVGFDGDGDPDYALDYDPNPAIIVGDVPATLTHPSDNEEKLEINGSSTPDPDTGSYTTITFTKDKKRSNEYKTTDLLLPYDDNPAATWGGGDASASVSMAGGEESASMTGSRVRVGMVGPKGNFTLPYYITVHFDGANNGSYSSPSTNIYLTNAITGKGNGTFQYYPAGKGIQLQPPYGHLGGTNSCSFYIGGSSSLSFLSAVCIPDGKDKPPCNDCSACAGNDPSASGDQYTPQQMMALGMPKWQVSEPYLNLWVHDTPVEYTTSLGEKIGFTMNYRQHDTRPRVINGEPALVPVTGWNHNWFSYVHFTGPGASYANWTATVYNPGGGETDFTAKQGPDKRGGDQLLPLTGIDDQVNLHGFRLVHSDGSQDIYNLITPLYPTNYTDSVPAFLDPGDSPSTLLTNKLSIQNPWFGADPAYSSQYVPTEVFEYNSVVENWFWGPGWPSSISNPVQTNCTAYIEADPSADALLTYHVDPSGHATHLSYSNSPSGQYFLQSVTDYDGNVTIFSYDSSGYLSQVSMPYSRTATFHYASGTNAFLTNVVDAQGMTTTFAYSVDDGVNHSITGDMTSMVTPYGTNSFAYFDADKDSVSKINTAVTRSIFITNPDATHEVYAYFNDATNSAPARYGSSEVPDYAGLDVGSTNTTVTVGAMYNRNSFYWGRSQSAAAGLTTSADASTMNGLGTNALLLARMRHWMLESDGSSISSACSMEQSPSPDGLTPGQRTWFLYPSSTQPWILDSGSLQAPEIVARLQPDGTTWYQSFSGRDMFGNPGTVTTHYVAPDSTPATITESYSYQGTTYSVDAGSGPVEWSASRFAGYTGPNTSFSYSFDYAPLTNSVGGYPVTYPNFSSVMVTRNDTYTTLFFNSNEQVSGGVLPNGLTVTNIYGLDGFLSKSIALEVPSTNTYTFSHGLPATWNDPNGLTRTFTWDNLERLTNIAYPDGTTVVNTYTNLNLASQKDRLNHAWTAHYDSMGRRTSFTDRNGNTTSFTYCGCGSLESITDPQMNTLLYGRDYANRITSATYDSTFVRNFTRDALGRIAHETNNSPQSFDYSYDNFDRVAQVTTPQGTVFAATYDDHNFPLIVQNAEGILVTNLWDDTGRHLYEQVYANGMTHIWNYVYSLLDSESDGVHSTSYGHDKAGQLISVHDANGSDTYFTYNPAGQLIGMTNANAAVTLWKYDIYGRMIQKTDANNVLVETNDYDADGRLAKHWTPAKGFTQYAYDNNGNTLSVAYSSGPSIANTYDSLNRIATMTDAVGHSAFTYQDFGPFWSALSSEDGPWGADTMSRTYHASGLPDTYALDGGWNGTYGYDSMLRLHTLSSPAGTFTYNYANATGRQISSLALPGSSTIAYGYEPAGLLTSTALKDSGNHVLDSYSYTYDAVGWRTNVLRADNSQVGYGYDSIGQLTSATGFESGGAPRYNENFGYAYDPAGNLAQRINDTLNQTFTVDPANQLTNVLRTTTVMTVAGGLTNTPTSLSINGQTANIYADKTFAATNVTLVEGVNIFTNVLTISGNSYTNQLAKNLPASANLSYDLNGNLTGDGLHAYEYDCANQLTRITQTNKFKSEFVYDGFGRRRIRREYAWTGTWVPTSETHYVYDRMLVIQERDGNNTSKVSYTRGVDLSGSDQGAGGIGGLLARTDTNGSAFYHADGNGNVTAMVNSGGTIVAKYLYDPYGNTLNKTGSLADANLYRFSSKEVHILSEFYYFGFRYYGPNLQRWSNRDPAVEYGGANLYEAVANSSVNFIDIYGLTLYSAGFVGPLQPGDSVGPFLSDPNQVPPGYQENWPIGSDAHGPYIQNPTSGRKYWPDVKRPDSHWPHYDWQDPDGKSGRYPEKCIKPRPGQKKLKPDQSETDPWQQPTSKMPLQPSLGSPSIVTPPLQSPVIATPGVSGLPTYPTTFPAEDPILLDPILAL